MCIVLLSPCPLGLKEGEKEELESIAGSGSLPHGKVQRAQIVLGCAEGESQAVIAERLGVSHVTVGKWCRRYHDRGIEGHHEKSAKPPTQDALPW